MTGSQRKSALVAWLVLSIAGCGQSSDDGGTAPAGDAASREPEVGMTARYDWYLERTTPAGRSTVVRTGDGRVTNESFVHWNNREYSLNSEIQLDEDGFIVAQTITGISPFGSPIDESFSYVDGVATWRTVGNSGSTTTEEPAFYMPNEWASIGALGAFVRAAENSLDNTIPLFPAGSARVEKLTEVEVEAPDGAQTLSLYALHDIGFTPVYAWFDKDLELAASGGGWLGMVPEGWDPAILETLDKIQSEEDAKQIKAIAGDLARRLQTSVVFENVDIADVHAGELLEDRHVHVASGKIVAVSAEPIDDDAALRIDASGKTLIPGLWDMHGHFGLADGVLNIAGGITNVRDIGNEHETIMDAVSRFDSGEVVGPNTYRSGFMDKAGPYASGWAAESLEDALERVDFFAEHGYLQIKLYSSIEPGWVAPIAERARSHGMRLSGHIPAFMSAEQAVNAGYNEIQHINMVFLNFLAGDREDTRQQIRFTLYGDEAGNLDLESDEVKAFFELLREKDVVVDATAAIFETQLVHLPGDPDPTFAAVIDHLPPSVARRLYSPEFEIGDRVEAWGRSAVAQAAMLKALHDNGIQLVPGSDYIAAFTLHRELEVYAEAGIPDADVLRIATLDSARVVGVDDRKGSIEVGKDSDLVLVDGNPLEDISAVRRGVLVMKGDTVYRPDELYEAVGVKPFLPSVEIRN